MTGSPVFSINLTYLRIPTNPNYHMSIKKSQAILKHFIDLKFTVWFTLCSVNKTMFCDTKLFSGRLPVKIVKTLNDRQSTLLAESLRSGKGKEERGKGKKERGKRKEERGKRKGEKGKRKEERGKRKEERGKRKLRKVVSVTKHGFVL